MVPKVKFLRTIYYLYIMNIKAIKYNGFIYEYVNELIIYNPNGGTNGKFICLGELEYDNALVSNVGNCSSCRKIVATDNSNLNLPMLTGVSLE